MKCIIEITVSSKRHSNGRPTLPGVYASISARTGNAKYYVGRYGEVEIFTLMPTSAWEKIVEDIKSSADEAILEYTTLWEIGIDEVATGQDVNGVYGDTAMFLGFVDVDRIEIDGKRS